MAWRWLGIGLFAGILAGATDALGTLVRGGGGLAPAMKPHLVMMGATVIGVVGGLVLALMWGLSRLVARLGTRFSITRPEVVAAVLLAMPLVAYDAFALFSGTQASRIPGHLFISVALVIVGAGGLYVAGRGVQRMLAGTTLSRGKRVAGALGFLLLAMLFDAANRTILPRLYPWFHLTLSSLSLAAWAIVVALVAGGVSYRRATAVIAGVLVLLVGGSILETRHMVHSQALRFYAHEKMQLLPWVVRFIPKRASAHQVAGAHLAPDISSLPAGPRLPGSDVVLITLDAVRSDHLSCQGYPRKTTPNLDALAARGVRFSRTYTQAPHTSFALASLMTGKYYPTLSRLLPSEKHDTLAAILRRYGWKTAAFFPPAVFYIDAQKMKNFESTYFDFEYVKYEYLDADKRVEQIESFLAAENPKKLFLWLHLFEAHEPYEKHDGFDFGDSDVDRYDSEIAFADKVLGDTLAVIRKHRPSAIVIVTADHGEEFGEHGGRYHGTTLYDEQTRVPFILAADGIAPRVIEGPTQVIDIPSTILGLLDVPVPVRMRGTDLGPWLSTSPPPESALPPVFSEVEDKRMVVTQDGKLICSLDKDYCSYFDVLKDPGEKKNLADEAPERVSKAQGLLDAWLASQTSYEREGRVAADFPPEAARMVEQVRLGDGRHVAQVASYLCGPYPAEARLEAAKALAHIYPPREEMREPLSRILATPCDDLVVDYASVMLLTLGDATQVPRVKALLARPVLAEHLSLYAMAAFALAERKEPEAAPILERVLDECDVDILLCRKAIKAFVALGSPYATQPLLNHLKVVLTRRETVIALGNLHDRSVIPTLEEVLRMDPYVPARVAAAAALAKFGGARAIASLDSAWERESDEDTRAAIRSALASLGRTVRP